MYLGRLDYWDGYFFLYICSLALSYTPRRVLGMPTSPSLWNCLGDGKDLDVDIFGRPLLTAEAAPANRLSEFSKGDEDPEGKLSETRWTWLS